MGTSKKTHTTSYGRRTRQGIGLTWLIVILSLAAGCSLLTPLETTGTTTTVKPTSTVSSSPTTEVKLTPALSTPSSSKSTTTAQTTPSAQTSLAIPTPTAQPSNPTPTPLQTTTAAKPTPTPATTQTGSADLSKLSLTPVSWWYNRPTPIGQDIPATIPDSAARMVKTWSAVWQARPTDTPTVYLTMDEGYEKDENTQKILDTARAKKVPIAFFITGTYLRNRPDLVKKMISEGHLVLNHTDRHPNLANLLRDKGAQAVLDDLKKLETDFAAATGHTMPRLVRPPEGAYSERLLGLMKQNGYRAVFWSFAYRDWITDDQPDPQTALDRIIGELHDGSVLLIHAVSDTNVAILPQLIDDARERGYRFGKLTEIP